MINIIFFKKVIDTYCHDAGNKVIKMISLLIGESISHSAIISRFGSEEFCILIADLTFISAKMLFNNLREEIADAHVPSSKNDQQLQITVCTGG